MPVFATLKRDESLRGHLSKTFRAFLKTEAGGGALLLACAAAALIVANSPWADAYHHLWARVVNIGMPLTVHQWINDGLMALFFLLVGFEIKQETVSGELSSPRKAALPVVAAMGGMLVPALIYLAINDAGIAVRGWAIPVATDIAFALGVLALVAPNAPHGLRIFLAALAIADDMGAVLVIALFYTNALAWGALGMAGVVLVLLIGLNLLGVQRLAPYLVLGVVLWFFVHESGVHATIAGVLLAFSMPIALFPRLEHGLHRFSKFVIMPVFAFSNAGVTLTGFAVDRVTTGVALGLMLGKSCGITAASMAVVRLGLAALPARVSWTAIYGCAWLGGIGFTMALFIAGLSFEGTSLLDSAKVGILGGSLIAAIVGAIVLRRAG